MVKSLIKTSVAFILMAILFTISDTPMNWDYVLGISIGVLIGRFVK